MGACAWGEHRNTSTGSEGPAGSAGSGRGGTPIGQPAHGAARRATASQAIRRGPIPEGYNLRKASLQSIRTPFPTNEVGTDFCLPLQIVILVVQEDRRNFPHSETCEYSS